MSFCERKTVIKEGDTVLIYVSFNKIYPIKVTRGLSHSTKYGTFKHADLIGREYGTQLECKQGTVYLMGGSPELWTLCLPHRTQILYTTDISMITLQLDLKPGSVVLESGTGSASLSHAIIRTIFPHGHLHTFEFHAQRAEVAKKEFAEHGMSDYVTVYNRDACSDGFGLDSVADAVFLDLPNPWKALESAKKAIKREGGRICTFSPCIEQVQKTCLELTRLGFIDVETIECLRRVLCVKKFEMNEFNFNMDWRPKAASNATTTETNTDATTTTTATDDVAVIGEKNEDNRETVTPMSAPAPPTSTDENVKKETAVISRSKRKMTKRGRGNGNEDDEDNDDFDSDENGSSDDDSKDKNRAKTIYAAKPINLQPGHTGFLTFATLLYKDYDFTTSSTAS